MNSLGLRPLMQTPQLPRITSRTPSDERGGGESARSIPRKPVEQHGRPRALSTAPATPSRLSTPIRDARPTGGRPAAAGVSEKSPLPASRAARPSVPVAKVVDAATVARLRPGTVVRIAVGEFVIDLVLRNSRLYGKVLAETESAKNLMEGSLDDLRRNLERRGIEIGALEVVVADDPPSEAPGLRSVRRLVLDVLA